MKKFKNNQVNHIMWEEAKTHGLSEEKFARIMQNADFEKRASIIIGGYLHSLFEMAEEYATPLDLTYDSVKDLASGLAVLYSVQRNNYSEEENQAIVAKTISVYLTLLCANVHDCKIRFENKIAPLMLVDKRDATFDNTWGGVSVYTGTEKEVDFYNVGFDCVKGWTTEYDGFFICMQPAIKAFKEATGDDLAEYGLDDILMQ